MQAFKEPPCPLRPGPGPLLPNLDPLLHSLLLKRLRFVIGKSASIAVLCSCSQVRRGSHNGRYHEDDIRIQHNAGGRQIDQEDRVSRRHSLSPPARQTYSTRDERDIAEEADYYNRRVSERAYIGEGYNGATKDWAIVDVPPGTTRVQMEGIGGANQEVTWQRYNGVRRSKFMTEQETFVGEMVPAKEVEIEARISRHERSRDLDTKDRGRRFVAEKEDIMWTEITKDLVIKDAIEEMGYDFEETEFFFYVMVYLRYVSPFSRGRFQIILVEYTSPPPTSHD